MRKALIGAGVAAAAVIVAVTAGSSTASSKATIPLLRLSAPTITTTDLSKTNAAGAIDQIALDTLMRLGKNGQPELWLAQSVSNPNSTTYVYTIRKGVKFWDGHELTANDVAYSLNYYRRSGSLDTSAFPASLTSITATAKYKVTFKLSAAYAAWPFILTSPSTGIFEKAFQKNAGTNFGQPGVLIMGTGPWEIKSLDPTSGAEFDANPHYWHGKVNIDHISMKFFSSEATIALAMRAGQIDLAIPSDANSFQATSGIKPVLSVSAGVTDWFLMNTLVAPFNDVHVRRAIGYALNRTDLIAASGGVAYPVYTAIPPQLLTSLGSKKQVVAALKNVPNYYHSVDKAKAEMAKSAYPNGANATIAAIPLGNLPALAQVVQAELKPIGINITIDNLSFAQWASVTTAADRASVPSQIIPLNALGPDPGLAYSYAYGSWNAVKGGFNISNYTAAAADALAKQGDATLNPTKRLAVLAKLNEQFGQDEPFVPLFISGRNVFLSSKFKWPSWPSTNGFYNFYGPWPLMLQAAK